MLLFLFFLTHAQFMHVVDGWWHRNGLGLSLLGGSCFLHRSQYLCSILTSKIIWGERTDKAQTKFLVEFCQLSDKLIFFAPNLWLLRQYFSMIFQEQLLWMSPQLWPQGNGINPAQEEKDFMMMVTPNAKPSLDKICFLLNRSVELSVDISQ